MSLLTDQEINALACNPENPGVMMFARAIESAVIAKLSAVVSVEPVGWIVRQLSGDHNGSSIHTIVRTKDEADDEAATLGEYWHGNEPLFTLSQLQTAIAQARVQENERCIELVKQVAFRHETIEEAIRALIGGPQP